jgi:EAL domain-containing protein (putative c-di-GMP-specific phosphodiesterase class I)
MNEMLAVATERSTAVATLLHDDLADGLTDDAMAWTPLASPETDRSEADQDPRPTTREILADIIEQGGPTIVFQPIHHLETGQVIGAEALSRFPLGLSTLQWFDEAQRLGLGAELELSAIAATVDRLDEATWGRIGWNFVGVNVSPGLVFDARFSSVIAGCPGDRLMVELTEESTSIAYTSLRNRLEDLRDMGMRIAVNSVKCEPTNLVRLLDIAPEVVKLDVSFTAALVREPGRRAIASEILRECIRSGVFVVAVGVEHDDELAVLRKLGVDAVQGHLFGQPRSIEKLGPRPVFPPSPRW